MNHVDGADDPQLIPVRRSGHSLTFPWLRSLPIANSPLENITSLSTTLMSTTVIAFTILHSKIVFTILLAMIS